MSFDLTGRRALVTGAGHGIGAAVALGLARAGADVVVHYGSSADPAERVVEEISALGRKSAALGADVTDSAAVERLIDESVTFLGGLDVVVANAGHLVARVPVAEMTEEHFLRVIDVNLVSAFRTCRAALPHVREAGPAGRIVLMASQAAHDGGGPGAAAYAAAKAGVIGFAKGLAKEVGGSGVTVNALAPGYIGGTAFHDTFTAPEAQRGIVEKLPVGRGGTADDVAGAAVYLASGEAGYVTGATFDIGGGAWPR
ncbi:SDR family NAD(P)-dependent oxidoreductase [Streptomyces sp. CNQ085]|uniref:SDR family NAD(P)-dependent oxidoreductase n=1 Tax=Streptomyces sp. CNQ085 TaxID=2886944 RepID=UPI001F5056AF|nr:SDR family oxidoreductase [Streptomyces sp. CNQ085]MCI0384972.1 SDR family oxidoreductase [Streptomyces sp. CNQ085]